jgi:hypothetical protein
MVGEILWSWKHKQTAYVELNLDCCVTVFYDSSR